MVCRIPITNEIFWTMKVKINYAAIGAACMGVVLLGLLVTNGRHKARQHPSHPQHKAHHDRGKSERPMGDLTELDESSRNDVDRSSPVYVYRKVKGGGCPTMYQKDLLETISSPVECTSAAQKLGLIDAQSPAAVEVESAVLPPGCYFKARTATYYQNFLNHTDEYYRRTEQRLFFNPDGNDFITLATEQLQLKLKPQHDHEDVFTGKTNFTRIGVCRVAERCTKLSQGRSCDDWMTMTLGLGYTCNRLTQYGLSCTGCTKCGGATGTNDEHARKHNVPGCGDDPRMHCRFEKIRHKHFSQYAKEANEEEGVEESATTNNNNNNNNNRSKTVRIVVVGDTHAQHESLGPIPPGDVFIHTGDFVSGRSTTDVAVANRELASFNTWLSTLPHKHKFFVAGNHDPDGEVGLSGLVNHVRGATHLLDTQAAIDLDGDGYPELTIYGSPWQPQFENFDTYVSEEEIGNKWKNIPYQANIVVTHTPPFGTDDLNENNEHVGSQSLASALKSVSPLLHVFGHIHSGRTKSLGDQELTQTPLSASPTNKLSLNVASQSGLGSTTKARRPIVIDVVVPNM